MRFELLAAVILGGAMACGGAPVPAEAGSGPASEPVGRRRADVADDCAVVPGQPPPEPLIKKYEGVAAAARCQREVYTIMGGLTHFLGVPCEHCHKKDDYPAPTHNKAIANWMARELIPSLEKRNATQGTSSAKIWCNDCHVVKGKGTAKILGNPRQPTWAVEWMTTHLVENFERSNDHKNLLCKDCHGGNLGSPEFRTKIILTEHLPPRPPKPVEPEPVEPQPVETEPVDGAPLESEPKPVDPSAAEPSNP